MFRIVQLRTDFCKLLADRFERIQHAGLVDDILAVSLKPLGCTLKSKPLHLHEHMDILECLHILLLEQTVTLGISLRTYELRELISPETHQRGAFAQNFGNFADCVKILFHINPLTGLSKPTESSY